MSNHVAYVNELSLELMPQDMKEDSFEDDLKIEVVHSDSESLEFDVIGIDVCYANALRRTIMNDVPTMAINSVTYHKYCSHISEEVFTHRLGLVPLKVDPRKFDFCKNEQYNETNSLEFELKSKSQIKKDSTKSSTATNNVTYIYSKQIKWNPIGQQALQFKGSEIGPIDPKILIAPLKLSEEINCKLIAVKGIGRTHAKFQPGHVFYRMKPIITLKKKFSGQDAHLLKSVFSRGTVDVKQKDGEVVGYIKNSRYDFNSRNYLAVEDFDNIEIEKRLNHIIFTVESYSSLSNKEIIIEACHVLNNKLETLYNLLDFIKI